MIPSNMLGHLRATVGWDDSKTIRRSCFMSCAWRIASRAIICCAKLIGLLNRFVDLSELRAHLTSFYSYRGRPSVDPDLMIRMLIVGYCFGIRSERRLCEEVDLNLAYRWFCRLGLGGRVPDHSTFSKARHGRFGTAPPFAMCSRQWFSAP